MLPQELYLALKECRLSARLSQEELARRLGCSQAWVSKVEMGKQEPALTDAAMWVHECNGQSLEIVIGPTRAVADAAELVRLLQGDADLAAIVRAALKLSAKLDIMTGTE